VEIQRTSFEGSANEQDKELHMSLSPQWEYLTVLVSPEFLDYEEIHPKSVNGQELKNWKKIDLNTFLSQLGGDHWEMTGTISVSSSLSERKEASYLFFKRIKP
jgi:hypothetical protein